MSNGERVRGERLSSGESAQRIIEYHDYGTVADGTDNDFEPPVYRNGRNGHDKSSVESILEYYNYEVGLQPESDQAYSHASKPDKQ